MGHGLSQSRTVASLLLAAVVDVSQPHVDQRHRGQRADAREPLGSDGRGPNTAQPVPRRLVPEVRLEGNRDYGVAATHAGREFDEVVIETWVARVGGHAVLAVHGDLANTRDRQYRSWRAISRARWVWRAFNLVPASRRRRLVDALELRMRSSNLEFKREFPEAMVRSYAGRFLAEGHDVGAF